MEIENIVFLYNKVLQLILQLMLLNSRWWSHAKVYFFFIIFSLLTIYFVYIQRQSRIWVLSRYSNDKHYRVNISVASNLIFEITDWFKLIYDTVYTSTKTHYVLNFHIVFASQYCTYLWKSKQALKIEFCTRWNLIDLND